MMMKKKKGNNRSRSGRLKMMFRGIADGCTYTPGLWSSLPPLVTQSAAAVLHRHKCA